MAVLVPEFLQTQSYTAARWRKAVQDYGGRLQPGVLGATDLKVTIPASFTASVAAGSAFVPAASGYYHVELDTAMTVTIDAGSGGSLNRLDQVCIKVNDTDAGDATNSAQLVVLKGTGNAATTIENRTGAVALPARHLRLCDVWVPPSAGSLSTATHTRDRRAWARGAHMVKIVPSNSTVLVTSTTSATIMTTTESYQRVELSGVPTRFWAQWSWQHDTVNAEGRLHWRQWGPGETAYQNMFFPASGWATMARTFYTAASPRTEFFEHFWVPPSAGSYIFGPLGSTSAGSLSIFRGVEAGSVFRWGIDEFPESFISGNTGNNNQAG
jgi:hypothetical protein